MWNIRVEKKNETLSSWFFAVEVVQNGVAYRFTVGVEKEYHKKLAGQEPAIRLVQESFLFLLEREPSSGILKEFNIKEIPTYFNEYEETMKQIFT